MNNSYILDKYNNTFLEDLSSQAWKETRGSWIEFFGVDIHGDSEHSSLVEHLDKQKYMI